MNEPYTSFKSSCKSLILTPTLAQNYLFNESLITIVKPQIGSLLYRMKRKTKKLSIYIVFYSNIRQKGKNRGIIDLVKLELINNIENNNVIFTHSNYPLILKLTNHGEWWSKKLKLEFKFQWDENFNETNILLSDSESYILPYERATNKKINSLPINSTHITIKPVKILRETKSLNDAYNLVIYTKIN